MLGGWCSTLNWIHWRESRSQNVSQALEGGEESAWDEGWGLKRGDAVTNWGRGENFKSPISSLHTHQRSVVIATLENIFCALASECTDSRLAKSIFNPFFQLVCYADACLCFPIVTSVFSLMEKRDGARWFHLTFFFPIQSLERFLLQLKLLVLFVVCDGSKITKIPPQTLLKLRGELITKV